MSFEQVKRGIRDVPFVTVRLPGVFYINKTMYNQFNLKGYKYADVMYNSETKEVGLKLLKVRGQQSFTLTKGSNNPGAAISCEKLFGVHSINPPKRPVRVYDITRGEGDMIIFPWPPKEEGIIR